jgi:hypothetical protein
MAACSRASSAKSVRTWSSRATGSDTRLPRCGAAACVVRTSSLRISDVDHPHIRPIRIPRLRFVPATPPRCSEATRRPLSHSGSSDSAPTGRSTTAVRQDVAGTSTCGNRRPRAAPPRITSSCASLASATHADTASPLLPRP